jgi:hypothetical protein
MLPKPTIKKFMLYKYLYKLRANFLEHLEGITFGKNFYHE